MSEVAAGNTQEVDAEVGAAANFTLNQATFIKYCVFSMVLILVAHIATQAFSLLTGHDVVMGLIPLFNMNAEANIPALFSTLLLLTASGLLIVNAIVYSKFDRWFVKYWLFLALLFVFLAVDEFSSLHERLSAPVRDTLGTDGLLYFAWVIPYAVLVLIVGLVLLCFMWRINRSTALGFVLAGIIFISGAAGMEMLGGEEASAAGQRTVTFVVFATVEEILEMSGVILFIHFILKDIFFRVNNMSLCLVPK